MNPESRAFDRLPVVLATILAINAVAEIVVMWVVLPALPALSATEEGIADALLLSCIAGPLTWWIVVRPLRNLARAEHERAASHAESLARAHARRHASATVLEALVAAGDVRSAGEPVLATLGGCVHARGAALYHAVGGAEVCAARWTHPGGRAFGHLAWRRDLGEGVTIELTGLTSIDDDDRQVLETVEAFLRLFVERLAAVEQLRQAKDAAETAARAKSDFLANMSHEIRTPMTAILGYAELMLQPHQTSADRIDAIQTIHRNGKHLLQVIDDVLDLSKIEAGALTIERIPFAPTTVLADVASLMRARSVEKSLGLEVLGDEVPATIVSDPLRVRQVLLNLVGNAIKFTAAGGVKIRARADFEAGRAYFDVIDTGIGMDGAAMSALFRPFSQADPTTTRRFGGTGLGLSISRNLARALGGDLTVVSTPGAGSCFTFSLDAGDLAHVERVEANEVRRATPGVPPPSTPRLSGRVLLAEDGPDNQRLVCALLRGAGATVDLAENGQQAVDMALTAEARGLPYAVILMDMQMPILDGYGATSLLRSKDYRGPIVAFTADAMPRERERCRHAGCTDQLLKPIDHATFFRTLTRWIPCAPEEASVSAAALVPEPSEDPFMAELIGMFVAELPVRSGQIARSLDEGDLGAVRRLAHQLRGAAGSYGFAAVGDAARDVELAPEGGHAAQVRLLVELVQRVIDARPAGGAAAG